MFIRKKVERFEIILPFYYNDSSPVEQYKIDETLEELGNLFVGYTSDSVKVSGFWIDKEGNYYHDESMRVRIDTPYLKENQSLFRFYKKILMLRFRQKDIWITVHEIKVL